MSWLWRLPIMTGVLLGLVLAASAETFVNRKTGEIVEGKPTKATVDGVEQYLVKEVSFEPVDQSSSPEIKIWKVPDGFWDRVKIGEESMKEAID